MLETFIELSGGIIVVPVLTAVAMSVYALFWPVRVVLRWRAGRKIERMLRAKFMVPPGA